MPCDHALIAYSENIHAFIVAGSRTFDDRYGWKFSSDWKILGTAGQELGMKEPAEFTDEEAHQNRLNEIRNRWPHMFRCAEVIRPPPGWLSLVDQMCAEVDSWLKDEERACFRWTQITSHFGRLKACFRSLSVNVERDRALRDLIGAFEAHSSELCEYCGKPATTEVEPDEVILTACPAHRSEYRSAL